MATCLVHDPDGDAGEDNANDCEDSTNYAKDDGVAGFRIRLRSEHVVDLWVGRYLA